MWGINKKGFTLIELLIVIAIIAILSAVGFSLVIITNLQKARDGKRKADVESLRSALEIYRSENGHYPNVTGDVAGLSITLNANYISAIPNDPTPGSYYYFEGLNCNGAGCLSYNLCAAMERSGYVDSCAPGSCGATCNYKTTNP